MPIAVPLRHELKYYINPVEYHLLSHALDQVLERDPNGDSERNEYHIRSLYFDTIDNRALSIAYAFITFPISLFVWNAKPRWAA